VSRSYTFKNPQVAADANTPLRIIALGLPGYMGVKVSYKRRFWACTAIDIDILKGSLQIIKPIYSSSD
jgi:hypothetical protein